VGVSAVIKPPPSASTNYSTKHIHKSLYKSQFKINHTSSSSIPLPTQWRPSSKPATLSPLSFFRLHLGPSNLTLHLHAMPYLNGPGCTSPPSCCLNTIANHIELSGTQPTTCPKRSWEEPPRCPKKPTSVCLSPFELHIAANTMVQRLLRIAMPH
jgi:hypothetical protein